ncbi:hypothetical protein M407DRAFT_241179 [Tulasnella calospora MUT 4182]|uniref:DUF431-domain-containing protein n=1 Tax=Tulasnella calospora MUT 4182 TaxID=1051891 RepID=A0A0C3QUS4_9AGAM|nr:hypothetical protein M407DRAFT_241179 [Tulasnella calospora MUT 4182]
MGFSFVIEHMEEDEPSTHSIPPWVSLEYQQIRSLVGPGNTVRFTHLSRTSVDALQKLWPSSAEQATSNVATTQVTEVGVLELMKANNIPLEKVCLLDPKATQGLSPEDGDGRFEWFLFGGILGDDPPRDRTSELRVLGFPSRHLDSVQMTTDTAVGVTKRVVVDKTPLNAIPYTDFPTIRFNAKESVEMPFRYIKDASGEPIMPPGMRQLLKDDLDKGFDF